MFTLDEITTAHQQVKSGADFPAYIQVIKKLGVSSYEAFVADGNTTFLGNNDYSVSTGKKHESIIISNYVDVEQFKIDLKKHQEGKTDYATFCNDCAKSGIEKWTVDLNENTCTYYDKFKNIILSEKIPQ